MPTASPTAGRVGDLLDRLTLWQRSRQQAGGLNPAQWEALRYLARANRYSCNPTTLAGFLGATKGTVSQTLIALERKRLVARRTDPGDRRACKLALTAAGRQRLRDDPLLELAAAASALDPPRQRALAEGLTDLLAALQRGGGRRSFGICHTCRFFRRNDATGEAGGPHRCGLTQEPLGDPEIALICAEHDAAA